MKIIKIGLRVWFTFASLFSFIGGWIMLAHSPKPRPSIPSQAFGPIPTLEPLAPLSEFVPAGNEFQDQPSFSMIPRNRSSFSPFFTTGGS